MQERVVTHRYVDPLDQLWIETARAIGLRVARDRDVFAATDGRGTLWLAPPAAFDADDCLAQMILHELCHSLVMGPESFQEPDWGLDNETDVHLSLEHACLRVQAALLAPLGLRQVLAPTTNHRAFYDALARDPFVATPGAPDGGSIVRARVALRRSETRPWAPHLGHALERTATIFHAACPTVPPAQRDAPPASSADGGAPPLSALLERRAPPHPSGFRLDPVAGRTCGECGWYTAATRGGRCRQVPELRADGAWPSCERFESSLDCLSCGACCREAYDVVVIGPREPVARRHPDLVKVTEEGAELLRPDGRCVALSGGAPVLPRLPTSDATRPLLPLHRPSEEPFTCRIYAERPRTCRDFERGGEHCLEARRRVGLSR